MKMTYDTENERSRFLQGQVKWANNILDAENIRYMNGRMSHECALEVLEKAEDELIDHIVLVG